MDHREPRRVDNYSTGPGNVGQLNDDNTRTANRYISSIRSAVERCIAHWKNWKILKTGYRGRLTELPNLIRTVTRLELYRLGW
ncbi:transposase family protein [Rathayibacter tritici]|uniref:DDE Tnp4 domain-containing protein n=1 Tax=Rathayibacter tritici TaxID=33888 RepID=A0A160KV25_9MICO|nr:transposase family protein [Rathayibacter tritici]AND17790.1 hypothetical protein A6122_2677 [Rathayibacter tritici]